MPDAHHKIAQPATQWTPLALEPDFELGWPSLQNLRFVFPDYICTAIASKESLAALKLCFPPQISQCCLVFDILPQEIQYIAIQLFNTHIRVRNKRRYIYNKNSYSIDITGSVKLRIPVGTDISHVLGHQVSAAFISSLPYLEEVSTGETQSLALSL
ncbi:hypothetical protein BD289DRAFT_445445, partial [Coniella lustricola]